jgi:hypothetical protein
VEFTAMLAQRGPASLTVPLRYTGSEPLVDLEVTVSGDHVTDVGDRGGMFDGKVANMGDVVLGDNVVLSVRTDGTAGPLTVTVDLRAAGGEACRLVVESKGFGQPVRVTQQPAD